MAQQFVTPELSGQRHNSIPPGADEMVREYVENHTENRRRPALVRAAGQPGARRSGEAEWSFDEEGHDNDSCVVFARGRTVPETEIPSGAVILIAVIAWIVWELLTW